MEREEEEGSVAGVFAMLNYFLGMKEKGRDTHEDVTAQY